MVAVADLFQIVISSFVLETCPRIKTIRELASKWIPEIRRPRHPLVRWRGAAWSGRDRHGRLIFTKDGKLFRKRTESIEQVGDLNGMQPDPVPAPAWAHRTIESEDHSE